MCVTEGV